MALLGQANTHLRPRWHLGVFKEGTFGWPRLRSSGWHWATPSWAGGYPLEEILWPSHGVRVACGKGLENMSKPIWVPWLPMWVEGVRKLSCLNRKSATIRVQMIWETTIVPAFSITIPLYETMKQKQLLQVMRVMLPISQIFCVLPSDTKQWETKNRKPQLRYMTSN